MAKKKKAKKSTPKTKAKSKPKKSTKKQTNVNKPRKTIRQTVATQRSKFIKAPQRFGKTKAEKSKLDAEVLAILERLSKPRSKGNKATRKTTGKRGVSKVRKQTTSKSRVKQLEAENKKLKAKLKKKGKPKPTKEPKPKPTPKSKLKPVIILSDRSLCIYWLCNR